MLVQVEQDSSHSRQTSVVSAAVKSLKAGSLDFPKGQRLQTDPLEEYDVAKYPLAHLVQLEIENAVLQPKQLTSHAVQPTMLAGLALTTIPSPAVPAGLPVPAGHAVQDPVDVLV